MGKVWDGHLQSGLLSQALKTFDEVVLEIQTLEREYRKGIVHWSGDAPLWMGRRKMLLEVLQPFGPHGWIRILKWGSIPSNADQQKTSNNSTWATMQCPI